MRVSWTTLPALVTLGASLAAQQFGAEQVVTQQSGPRALDSADLDGDGDRDLAVGLAYVDRVVWLDNEDGQGGFGTDRIITTSAVSVSSLSIADLDGDGDPDVLAASSAPALAWHENVDGLGTFAAPHPVPTSAVSASYVFVSDLDGVGDMDVLSGSENQVQWHENLNGDGLSWSDHVVTGSVKGVEAVCAADLDLDGDSEALSASAFDDKVAWYENADGLGGFGPQQLVASAVDYPLAIHTADLDGDGDPDVLAASFGDEAVSWYENLDGSSSFGPEQVVEDNLGGPETVLAEDVDGDGDLDVLSASEDYSSFPSTFNVAWHENTNGLGSFGPANLLAGSGGFYCEIVADDFDGDGDRDVAASAFAESSLTWHRNLDGLGSFGGPAVLAPSGVLEPRSVFAADLDGDGDLEALSASRADDKIAWYENVGGPESFGPQRVLSTSVDEASSVHASDLDGDGDMDVLGSAEGSDEVVWFENGDGHAAFGSEQVVSSGIPGPGSVLAVDLDGDGDADVLSGSGSAGGFWTENTDGSASFGPPQLVGSASYGARSSFARDLDGDGDVDVLVGTTSGPGIVWHENVDGLGSFGPPQIVTDQVDSAFSVYAEDLDEDGDQDVLCASLSPQVSWYENADGDGLFGAQHVLLDGSSAHVSAVAADLDGDQDLDVLSAGKEGDEVVWWKNWSGVADFGPQLTVSSSVDHASAVFAADLDGDGDQDVLSAAEANDRIYWHENRLAAFSRGAVGCPAPSSYGAGEAGSAGTSAVIGSAGGLPSVSNPSFEITLEGGQPSSPSLLLESAAGPASTPVPWGTLLVAPPFLRHLSHTDGNGNASYTVPMTPAFAGTTLHYTWIVQDAGFGGGLQHSDGLAVTFCP